MELQDAKDRFIQAWGTLGSDWGVNRTMAQVHALLMISPQPLSAEDIMEELKISRGNANMNIRALIDWGLVHKELKPGDRKEYFVAERDMWEVIRKIIIQRKKRELEPVIKVLNEVSEVEQPGDEAAKFIETVKEIKLFASKADATLDSLIRADASWFVGTFMKMVKS
jgi:DNA-binding transcriptional regulator GbsR (MarR family)